MKVEKLKRVVYFSDELLAEKIKYIFNDVISDGEVSSIIKNLNTLNPNHRYYNAQGFGRIMFFSDCKYEVFPYEQSYQDIIMIFPHIFKTKIYFKNVKIRHNFYNGIIIDNELMFEPLIQNLNLTRFNAIKYIKNHLATKYNVDVKNIIFNEECNGNDCILSFTINDQNVLVSLENSSL